MIKSAIQLKAKVRNYSGGDDRVSKALIRVFIILKHYWLRNLKQL